MEAAAGVLVVDDDRDFAQATARILERSGFDVRVATSGDEALQLARNKPPQLMLLDFEMADMDGAQVVQELKCGAEELPFPVLMLTGARVSVGDQVVGLEIGATDYVLKGVDHQVLVARIRRALREHERGSTRVRRGGLVIDVREGRAWAGGEPLFLERKPLAVLYELAMHAGTVVSREQLLQRVWGTDFKGFEHSVEQAVYAIRKAIGDDKIQTVQGSGYRFVERA